ncbi:MAG: ribbon-helix-helix protein, CopG family [Phycisphaerales bacterium]
MTPSVEGASTLTSIRLPEPLLAAVDRRAKSLRLSRTRLIIQALERELPDGSDWSPWFFERLGEASAAMAPAVDEMLAQIRRGRRSGASRRP